MQRSDLKNPAWIELLEGRQLLSHAPLTPEGKGPDKPGPAAHAKGKPAAPAKASVSMDAAGIAHAVGGNGDDVIAITIDRFDPSKLDVVVNGAKSQFPFASVKGIAIDGGPGNDAIEVSELNGTIDIPVTLTGGPGNDTLVGGSGNDLLDGGPGNDLLAGQAGDDTLTGGSGDDTLFGGAGNNSIDGGPGSNFIPSDNGTEGNGRSSNTAATSAPAAPSVPPMKKAHAPKKKHGKD